MTSPSASPEIGPWRRARPLLGTYVEITLDAPRAPYPALAFETAFAETVRVLGRIDGCFANAGVAGLGASTAFADMSTDEWRRVLDEMLMLTRAVTRVARSARSSPAGS